MNKPSLFHADAFKWTRVISRFFLCQQFCCEYCVTSLSALFLQKCPGYCFFLFSCRTFTLILIKVCEEINPAGFTLVIFKTYRTSLQNGLYDTNNSFFVWETSFLFLFKLFSILHTKPSFPFFLLPPHFHSFLPSLHYSEMG